MTRPLSEGWHPDPSLSLPDAVIAGDALSQALVPPPQDDSFYRYTGTKPLADIAPGTVLSTPRTVGFHVLGVPTGLSATQLLYRSTSQTGKPTANVTSVIKPLLQAGRPKVLSFQSAYDSLSRGDQPSYQVSGGVTLGGTIASIEASVYAPLLAQGFTVIVPDTEGQRADFAAGPEYGRNTLDSIRAVFSPESTVGLPPDAQVALLGYSGGAIASEWAAEMAPSYAPDVDARLIGAAIGGVLVHPAHNLHYVEGTYGGWAGVMPMALIGITRAFEKDAEFRQYLTPRGRAMVDAMQTTSIAKVLYQPKYWGLRWADLVVAKYPTPESLPLFVQLANQLIMGTGGTPTVPMFIGQGDDVFGPGDGVMLANDVRALAHLYCAKGVAIEYHQYPLGHIGSLALWMPQAISWVKGRFADEPALNNCAAIGAGGSLEPLPTP